MGSTKDESVLVGDRNKAEQSCSLDRTPFTTRTVRQRYHNRLKIIAHDLKLADTLELHGLACQVLLWGYCICEDVQQHSPTARCVYTERYDVVYNRLDNIKINLDISSSMNEKFGLNSNKHKSKTQLITCISLEAASQKSFRASSLGLYDTSNFCLK